MRITISHNKSKERAIQMVDQAIEDAFTGLALGPIQIVNQQKSWSGSVMKFSLTAKMGFLKNPVAGTVEVTDRDVTIDADLGMLNRFIPEDKVRTTVEMKVRGLLS
jgi:Putative polyhydroxyalkanoic acid system protein (PHA_gran_rgn)